MFSHDPLLVISFFISMSFLDTHMNVYTYSYYQFHLFLYCKHELLSNLKHLNHYA